MRVVIPDPKSLSPTHPVHERDHIRSARDSIAADKVAWAQVKRGRIQDSLDGVGGRQPIVPREVAQPGNVSMHDHLQALKARLDGDPEGEADSEIDRVQRHIDHIESRLKPKILWSEDA